MRGNSSPDPENMEKPRISDQDEEQRIQRDVPDMEGVSDEEEEDKRMNTSPDTVGPKSQKITSSRDGEGRQEVEGTKEPRENPEENPG